MNQHNDLPPSADPQTANPRRLRALIEKWTFLAEHAQAVESALALNQCANDLRQALADAERPQEEQP